MLDMKSLFSVGLQQHVNLAPSKSDVGMFKFVSRSVAAPLTRTLRETGMGTPAQFRFFFAFCDPMRQARSRLCA
ncbi:hypothetical protein [Cupriavidus basilensis]|uniref:hypothetical protein n=1 Tax=Cupriavidus basilensis TaxID=68895 RepID=UPI0011474D6D|nr:hypothetical protein [Cupriavidus basilensis]